MKNISITAAFLLIWTFSFSQNICKRKVSTFSPSSTSYTISGSATLTDSLGALYLSFSSTFSTNSGPDLYIYLSIRNQAPTVAGNTNIEVAKLSSFSGAQTYVVPSGVKIGDYDFVTIHCKRFNSFWDGGPLGTQSCINIASYDTISKTACLRYLSPSKKYTWTKSGAYMDTLRRANARGGDSILSINLTVKAVDNGIVKNNQTLMATDSTARYQWIECATQKPIVGDTNRSFTSTKNGFYAVVVTKNGCSDTSKCESITFGASTSNITDTSCHRYRSPSGKYVWDTSGIYTDTIQNGAASGSDSIISIMLTIKTVDTAIAYANLVMSSSAQNAAFEWYDCDLKTLVPNSTRNTFVPNKVGNFAAVISQNGCVDTTTCYEVKSITNDTTFTDSMCFSYTSPSGRLEWTTSGTYNDTIKGGNIAGGDSILTINVIIHTIDTGSVDSNGTIIAKSASGSVFFHWYDCDNDSLVPNEFGRRYTPKISGNYAVILLDNDCVDTSKCHRIIISKDTTNSVIATEVKFSGIEVFPNPTSGIVYINLEQIQEESLITVINISGEVVSSQKSQEGQNAVINLGEVRGLYFIQVESQSAKKTFKVINR
ncbi:MAG: hypothetical protein CL840_09910 [Crocinitomicaceae bacterium]|nr:hypothetical protein [Crocinitomicaceae bacterium]|tara:strand:- start:1188 stop:2984 length:1797 start_codon:yes stop_codon:yes gene_type:complete